MVLISVVLHASLLFQKSEVLRFSTAVVVVAVAVVLVTVMVVVVMVVVDRGGGGVRSLPVTLLSFPATEGTLAFFW